MVTRAASLFIVLLCIILSPCVSRAVEKADLILLNGKIVTVDHDFSIAQAMAIQGDRILRIGKKEEVIETRGGHTKMVDLEGKTVLPGLIDSHCHPIAACMTEFDHPIPQMDTIQDVLDYIQSRVVLLDDGEWILVRQVFITRLREQRYPTREELDRVAPKNPVVFATGPDASLNSLALKLSGIDKDFKITDGGPGHIERDPETGEPTGILRSCTRYVKSKPSGKPPTENDRYERLIELFNDYNSVGITGVGEGAADSSEVELFRKLYNDGNLSVRTFISRHIHTIGPMEQIQENIRKVAEDPLYEGDLMLHLGGIKVFLDGGMLTGSAYMRKPWGVSKIYAIDDPEYRGVLFIPPERLVLIIRTAIECDLQFAAHTVGDGAVHAFLDACEELSREMNIRKTRPRIIHSNFMSREAVDKIVQLGVVIDVQPAWLYLDTRTLASQFGYDRLRYFQPLRSVFEAGGIAAGGSDHMQKIGSLRSINPYNPFLSMWVTLTRKARWYDGRLHPEEALTREQAIRFYTINSAYVMFLEEQTGSLEEGKLADFIVIDRDILRCPVDAIKDTQVLKTYLNGELVYQGG